MRLTSDRAKQAILHPEQHVREAAVYYFSRSFSQDKDIVPLAIRAIEQYGQDAFQSYSFLDSLVHTDETVLWMIGQLASLEKPPEDLFGTLWGGVNSALRQVDPEILKNHASQILSLDCIDPALHESIQERIRFLTADPTKLWADLEDFCERHKNDHQAPAEELDHASRLVEALGRHPGEMAERVIAFLRTEIEDYQGNPMTWMEPYAIRLAGMMHLEQTIPDIVDKLHEDDDWLNSECLWALTRIGTDSVVQAMAQDFPEAELGFCFQTAGLLEDIHSDLSVQTCFKLLEDKDKEEIRRELYKALLINGDTAAIEPARMWLLENDRDPDWLELRADLVTAATIMEVDFPELSEWKEDMQHDTEFRKQWYAEHVAPGLDLYEEPDDLLDEDDDLEEDEDLAFAPPADTIVAPKRPGRNDPCPCGSGKKYKKCCLRMEKGASLN